MEPCFHAFRPCSYRKSRATQTIPMSALGVDMQLGRHIDIFKLKKIYGRVLHMNVIIFRLNNEGGRRLSCNMNVRIWREVQFRDSKIPRVDDHGKIRSTALLV